MPIKICSFAALQSVADDLEASGNELVSVSAANDDTAIITYRAPKVPKGRETR